MSRRPASVSIAALAAWVLAGALAVGAVVIAATDSQPLEVAATGGRPPLALAAVTLLCTAAALVTLGALAAWQRKTDLLLVFALWLVLLGAIGLSTIAAAIGDPVTGGLGLATGAASALPIVLLLRRSARAWLPPIPLHDAVIVLLFGPVVGLALIAARHRDDARLGLA
ncbi:hypothetical protein [Schumannella luteola]